jgi:hypothetical protein
MTYTVFGLARDMEHGQEIVGTLRNAGFAPEGVSVLAPNRDPEAPVTTEKHSKAPEGAAAGAGTGGLVGGAFGWLVGVGALAIPGLGPFVAAGPIMAALSGAAVGAAVGGLGGSLVGLGLPEYEVKAYEREISGGRVLIAVTAHTPAAYMRARQILEREGLERCSFTETVAV